MPLKLALPAGLSPATATFEASHSDTLSYGSEMEPTERLALSRGRRPAVYKTAAVAAEPRRQNGESPRCCPVLCGLRDRCIASMLATLVAVCKDRDAMAEL